MARSVKLDLRGAPPVTGGMRDHVPPGRYRTRIVRLEDSTSRNGKRMWVGSFRVSEGEFAGSNLGDNFVLVDNNNGPSKMGLGRLHHLLLCLGFPVKEAVINLDLDRLNDLEVDVDVADEHFTDTSGGDRLSSSIKQYHSVSHSNGNGAVAENGASAAVELGEPEISSTPEVPETPEAEPETVEVEAVATITAEATEEVADAVEDLFK